MNFRIRVSGVHFLISVGIAVLAALLVFLVWYPPPYAVLAGGLSLFVMLVAIDVVLGPCLTAVVANSAKPRAELVRDIALIALIQLLALGYGMNTIALARPVYLVFEVDRFRVVSAADVDSVTLVKAPAAYRQLPWTGPTLIATRKAMNQNEMLHSLGLGLQGVDIAMQPERWTEYAFSIEAVLSKARPAKLLLEKYPQVTEELQAVAAKHAVEIGDIFFLPLVSRKSSGVVLVSVPKADIVGYLMVDGFF